MLDIQHLTKTYGEKKAVDDLSLRIAPGEIYGFIGHNGAGKTTTLKAAVGILQFDAGDIFIGGKSIRTDPLGCKRQLAYIPDNPDLYDFMSGIQYLNFIADIFGIPAAERWARIEPLARCRSSSRAISVSRQRVFARHEAEARHHRRVDPRPEAHPHGRALRRARPEGGAPAQGHDARGV